MADETSARATPQDVTEARVAATLRAALRARIAQVVAAPASEGDARWIVRLLRELCARLNALTPSRADLHAELDAALDAPLVEQMLRHGAADAADLAPFAARVIARLRALVAPAQDDDVDALDAAVRAEPDAALALARLLCDADDVLRETERLNRWCADRMEAALAARGQR